MQQAELIADPPEICARCQGTGWGLVTKDGIEFARRCSCAQVEARRKLLARAGIPAHYLHCTLDSFEIWNPPDVDPTLGKAKRLVGEFVDLYPKVDRGLLLMGNVGTGKTHLGVAALQYLITNKGVKGRFVGFGALIIELQLAFNEPGQNRGRIEPLIECELLVVDELGAGKTSPWALDMLYYLVNSRYVEERVTIFTTNYSDFARKPDAVAVDTFRDQPQPRPIKESLTDRVSERVRSRLFEMCRRIELRGDDYRRNRLAYGSEGNIP